MKIPSFPMSKVINERKLQILWFRENTTKRSFVYVEKSGIYLGSLN